MSKELALVVVFIVAEVVIVAEVAFGERVGEVIIRWLQLECAALQKLLGDHGMIQRVRDAPLKYLDQPSFPSSTFCMPRLTALRICSLAPHQMKSPGRLKHEK